MGRWSPSSTVFDPEPQGWGLPIPGRERHPIRVQNHAVGSTPGSHSRTLVLRIDHIYIASPEPDPLFTVFSETLRLPVAWPMDVYGPFRSAGVLMGNTAIELVIFDSEARRSREARRPTSLRGIAFEPALPEAALLDELDARGVEHSQPESASAKGFSWTAFGLSNMVRGQAVIFFCRYHQDETSRRREILQQLGTRSGGSLGVLGIEEVVIGTTDLASEQARWQRLLSPLLSNAGRWDLSDGPAIRLVAADADGIVALVVRVRSLAAAEQALRGSGLLGTASKTQLTITPGALQGIDVRLTGAPGSNPGDP